MRRICMLVMLALLPAPLAAQAKQELTVGDERVDGTRLRPGSWTLRFVRGEGESAQEVATLAASLARITHDGQAAFRFVQSADAPGGAVADTVVFFARTLQPISHRSHSPTRTLLLDYHGQHVMGSMTPASGEAKTIDQAMDVAAFDGGILDLLFGTLDLEPGAAGVLPVYIYENGGPMRIPFRVDKRTHVEVKGESRPAFALSVDYPFGKGTVWVDAETRHPLGAEITMANGMKTRLVR